MNREPQASLIKQRPAAFDVLVQVHYRFYLFYANMVVAIAFAVAMRHVAAYPNALFVDMLDVAAVALAVVFFAVSRDTLTKYYRRDDAILSPRRPVPHTSNKRGHVANPQS